MDNNGIFIYNPEFEVIQSWLAESSCQQVKIDPGQPIDMSKTKLIGSHNAVNALMAWAAAKACGVESAACQKALDEFKPLPHRLQLVAVKNGVTYIDDAIGSNPEATITGITTIIREMGPIGCIMLGGQDRSYEYWPLVQLISRLAIPFVVLFPDTGAKIKALRPASYNVEFFETRDMSEAVKWAAGKCTPDTICLLSTAAPSYSIWKDFEEKGDKFQEAVNAL